MKETWDQRYAVTDYVYGYLPNAFLKSFIDGEKPGSIFLPCEGEGRNAVYAARQNWDVYALDYSESGKQKALAWARDNNVQIVYEIADLITWDKSLKVDVIALIYAHFQPEWRPAIHKKLTEKLKPGGKLIMEAFSKNQIHFNTGGPRDIEMLYSTQIIRNDFQEMDIELLTEQITELNEGPLHSGKASVIRMIAKKLSA
jgi:SAM-dependent methyltransferase